MTKQKTIGINPLEEYLASSRAPKKQLLEEEQNSGAKEELERPIEQTLIKNKAQQLASKSEMTSQEQFAADPLLAASELGDQPAVEQALVGSLKEQLPFAQPQLGQSHLSESRLEKSPLDQSIMKHQAMEHVSLGQSSLAQPRPDGQGSLAGKQRITLHISADVVDRVKNAVYWEPGLTLAGFAEEALENALKDLETHRGAPFPQRREHRLRGGRPII